MVPCSQETTFAAEIGTEMAQVVTAWPALPRGLRQGILAMIQATRSEDSPS